MSVRITIPIAEAHKVIAETVARCLKAQGVKLAQVGGIAGTSLVDEERVIAVCSDIGRNSVQALMVIDETPIEEVELEYEPDVKPTRSLAAGEKRKR